MLRVFAIHPQRAARVAQVSRSLILCLVRPVRATSQSVAALLLAFSCFGCAAHIPGRVVDATGRPVANAHVKIYGMFHGALLGEGPIRDETVSDAQGRFAFTEPGREAAITATSADGKRKGQSSVSPHGETVVVVR